MMKPTERLKLDAGELHQTSFNLLSTQQNRGEEIMQPLTFACASTSNMYINAANG